MNLASDRALGAACGLAAAVLFGASAPIAKLLLPQTSPLVLAGLFYTGAGLAMTAVRVVRSPKRAEKEARLERADLGALIVIAVTGGLFGPILMLIGLNRTTGLSASLLLNLEAPFTMLLAILFFREHLGRRAAFAAALIVGGAALLAIDTQSGTTDLIGCLAIAAACACWALDNNLTQRLSLRDPIVLVQLKALSTGPLLLISSAVAGLQFPPGFSVFIALLVGSLSYGASITLDAIALRHLGAAREAALFATAPFAGALLSILLLDESPTVPITAGGAVMIAGVVLLLRAQHSHLHRHDPIEHAHRHVHDEHHQHHHDGPFEEPHTHPHKHDAVTHDHPHASDLHHRHPHD